jgi:hypothetical protein
MDTEVPSFVHAKRKGVSLRILTNKCAFHYAENRLSGPAGSTYTRYVLLKIREAYIKECN